MESPDVHTPHAHPPGHGGGGLPRWLELTLAISALVTSVASIALAVKHGDTMEKLVVANSFPYMQGGFSDMTPDGRDVLSLDLLNRGVGPAHETSLFVTVDGHYVRSSEELITASIGPGKSGHGPGQLATLKNSVPTRFIPGGQQQFVLSIAKTADNAANWDLLQKAQPRMSTEFCYCSVFHECWRVVEKELDPVPVKACVRDEKREFTP
ncbi:MAG: hypothetical protein JF588_06160 [Caulobacterales bacterium]|nr:hypothetical protein [Caulobacterales bacterium]